MSDIVLTDLQAAAVRQIVAWYQGGRSTPQEFYLAGYAGTGKSTIAKTALSELRAHAGVKTTATATFTGKAANVLRKKGIYDARTIHSLIYIPVEDPDTGETVFRIAPEAPAADVDLIMLDECSMVGEEMADDLRSFGKKTLVMGDPGQLPPINGMGAFTRRDPDAFLHEVHRQAAGSPILRLATMARMGERLPLGEWTDDAGNVTRVLQHSNANQGWIYRPETQALCGVHRVRWGYTQRIRSRRGLEGHRPLPGETLICCKNDRKRGTFNGGFGVADAVEPYILKTGDREGEAADDVITLDATMEDLRSPLKGVNVHTYLFDQHFDNTIKRPQKMMSGGLMEFDWGYILTCHKSQGSEWPDVTVIDDSGSFKEDRSKWAYTAITRAAESLTFLRRD